MRTLTLLPGMQSCVSGDGRCLIGNGGSFGDLVRQSGFFPDQQHWWPQTRAVSCGGLARLTNNGAMLKAIM